MRPRIWISAALLFVLMAGATAGLMVTRDAESLPEPAKPAAPKPRKGRPRGESSHVDQRPLHAARRLLALARTPEEIALARQAERLANHEVDLAFAEAMRQAVESVPPPTTELKALQAAKAKAEAAVAEDERNLKRLNGLLSQTTGEAQDRLEDQIEITKAQLELDQDELEEATETLAQRGGDPQAKLRQLKAARDAADPERIDAIPATASKLPPQSLLARSLEWNGQRTKRRLLETARQEAQSRMQLTLQRQQTLSQQLKEDLEARTELKAQASRLSQSLKASKEESETARETMRYFAQQQRGLAAFVRQSQDQRNQVDVYGAWIGLAEGYERTSLHNLMKSVLLVLGVMAGVFLINRLAELFIAGRSKANPRAGTHRTVVKIITRGLGLVVVVFLAVGLPAQTSTVLGLTGAGLTVALKDYIVAFFGWFMLMGKNGIRVGDWVEIKGVGGEVVEVGLLRTVILETGSWSDSGHPTGRRVAFVNSFAMEGHYFNFSTSGQWMWDELKVLIPPGQDPYPLLEGVQRLVEAETRANADVAEQEWRKTTSRYRVRAFSTTPGIQVVPTAQGVEIRARYITQAFHRHETRKALYQAVVDLMHGRPEEDLPPRAGAETD